MGSITNNILLFIFFVLFFPFSNARCIESERKSLLEFRASLVNDSNSLSSWTGRDCCSWRGITCHNLTGHVQVLNLGGYYFNSSLSPWLFNLTHLEVFRVSSCGFRGSIPNLFDKLAISLTVLDLSGNQFDSAAFPDSLCSFTSLTVMQIQSSELQGSLISCLGNLTSLTHLMLDGNELSGKIPGWLGNLTHLETLGLSGNHFNSSIPISFGNLQDLEILSLSGNQLSGAIPSSLGNLTKLKEFYVYDNFLMGDLSESFFNRLKSLHSLSISRNQNLVLNVSPQWIPTFQLKVIKMNSVFIGTIFPQWLQTQRNLEVLYMSNVSISGDIPHWYLNEFPRLAEIDLSYNLLTGLIPNPYRTTFPNLRIYDVSYNLLTGSVPIFNNAPLEFFILAENQLSGKIPQQLCNFASLQDLSLANNQLSGTIPSCLGSLERLFALNLEYNSLSDNVPGELGSLRLLNFLHLNGNKFYGELPESFQNLSSLITLDLGENDLRGSIPEWIGKEWSRLRYLRLESNNFSGEIPVNLCQLPSLQILNLALNNLVGTIPPCIGNLSQLLSDESHTSIQRPTWLPSIFKGREMRYTSNLPYAKFLILSGNQLQGQIPLELMNLKGLIGLNLSNNEISGMIPETINNLKHLESLDLSLNQLSGIIPQSLANIDALSYLNLSFNHFEGKVPSGNHFDTLDDPSIYEGNSNLCGKPLKKSCILDDSQDGPVSNADAKFEFLWFSAGVGPGFAIGFLGVIFILYFKHIAYFGFLDKV